jgi:hypothetical protein
MARAALRWSVKELATKARVSANTVVRFENEKHEANEVTVFAIKAPFEAAGLIFVNETGSEGVLIKKSALRKTRAEGREADDVPENEEITA